MSNEDTNFTYKKYIVEFIIFCKPLCLQYSVQILIRKAVKIFIDLLS